MDDARQLWSWWQSLLAGFGPMFTRPGWVRFVQWVTGMVMGWEEHTITQSPVSMDLASRWRAMEQFAEYGAWDRPAVERRTIALIERERAARWGGYHPVAVDDTKLHRTSGGVWGTRTFHESAARSPNRAETVRAHNWVVAGDLLPGQPWTFLPHSSRLYFRRSQLPDEESFRTKTPVATLGHRRLAGGLQGREQRFWTSVFIVATGCKTQWALELLRQADGESEAPILTVLDGAYAMKTVGKVTSCFGFFRIFPLLC